MPAPDSARGDGSFSPIPLPAGAYRMDAATDAMLRCGSPARPAVGNVAHPAFALVAALGGMGVSVAELCRLCGSSIENGPVLARCALHFHRPLSLGQDYDVEAEVASILRKRSRRFGAADHVQINLVLRHDGQAYTDVELVMVMPTSGAA